MRSYTLGVFHLRSRSFPSRVDPRFRLQFQSHLDLGSFSCVESLWCPSCRKPEPGQRSPVGVPRSLHAIGGGIPLWSGFELPVAYSESWSSHLGVREPVVSWRIWVSLVKFSELLQTTYQKVVEWFFRPVFAFWIVKPFDHIRKKKSASGHTRSSGRSGHTLSAHVTLPT